MARTADDLPRYHGKMMIVDDALHVFGFNYTKLDIEQSRSFGIVTRDKRIVQEAASAVRGRRDAPELHAVARALGGQPGELARAADRVHQGGARSSC